MGVSSIASVNDDALKGGDAETCEVTNAIAKITKNVTFAPKHHVISWRCRHETTMQTTPRGFEPLLPG